MVELGRVGLEGVHAGLERDVARGEVERLGDDQQPRGLRGLEHAAPLARLELGGLQLLALGVAPGDELAGAEDRERDRVGSRLEGGFDQPQRDRGLALV